MISSKVYVAGAAVGVVVVGALAMMRHEKVNDAIESAEKPNVIVVLLDDLGSQDVGFAGCADIPTPNIDRIATGGVNCTNAYISAPYSGPSRCGLMTGRYQQRFGADGNCSADQEAIDTKQGVLESEVLLSNVMKEQGYTTAAIGKWHLGDHPDLWPNKRGFDYFYGFSGGSFGYWGGRTKNPSGFIQENGREVPADETTYLTDDFTNKAVNFIDKSCKSDDPFFLYLAYNAPHAPLQAPKRYLDRTAHIYNAERSIYAAMILAVDDGLGQVWSALERNNVDDNTMIIFLSDNGGVGNGWAHNTPRRAFKGNMMDGGIHTPFAIYWKGRLMPGATYDKAISSLDIFATVATAAGADISECKNPLDGVDLMPYLSGENGGDPHKRLFWQVSNGLEYAVLQGDYKLIKTHYSDNYMLFNVKKDPIEMVDIASSEPKLVNEMAAAHKAWSSEMMESRWEDAHELHQRLDYKNWSEKRRKASGGR